MKNLILLILLFTGLALFEMPAEPVTEDPAELPSTGLIRESSSDMEECLEILSKDLKTCHFLTPRRNIQHVHQTINSRVIKHITKLLRDSRLKGEQKLYKISHIHSHRLTIHLSSLLCRRGYHIYALRKILI